MNGVVCFALLALSAQICMTEKIAYHYVGSLPGGGNNVRNSADSSYYFSSTATDWSNAWFTCEQVIKGKLLAIESQTENNFVRDLMIRENRERVWTSGAYDPYSGLWKWASTGQEIGYGNWGPQQPYGNSTDSRIVVLNSLFSNAWITINSTEVIYAICEVSNYDENVTTPTTTTTTEKTTTTSVTPCRSRRRR